MDTPLARAFIYFDSSRSGKISAADLEAILSNPSGSTPYSRDAAKAKAAKLIAMFDAGDGMLHYEKFIAFLGSGSAADQAPAADDTNDTLASEAATMSDAQASKDVEKMMQELSGPRRVVPEVVQPIAKGRRERMSREGIPKLARPSAGSSGRAKLNCMPSTAEGDDELSALRGAAPAPPSGPNDDTGATPMRPRADGMLNLQAASSKDQIQHPVARGRRERQSRDEENLKIARPPVR
mmetsp:Transcript_31999/g.72201  ORF Transcript_31999/g.72201 Transcript_31999/m.72201 type:complete len:238 (-) Transcript_31999:303-1016(-)|eukprot:CAMPEP_0181200670 /NCGR_PEP_ID=MMETSP1096-20121128/17894_1 /TAXON_ID=156174 ORGANISM="Chrysochromulina ericina, Strain CCMP281" /NCGR_SAMPLE_ID=MMETSP1096 /ASSEMBLY_ACC=CAM_ASM_000453 /LENGTH=237 /DNA_ID=CAMNT_0023291055 /DNA_START=7 /DNA_END=720 /DNA_ORIENTATION=+